MKDRLGFVKNFDIKIPHIESFNYYINTLVKSKEYSNLNDYIKLWEDYENNLEDSPKNDKAKTLIFLVEHFKSLIGDSINEFIGNDNNLYNLDCKKNFVPEDGKYYVSFDVRQGNWTVIRKAIKNNLPDWEEYLTKNLNIHPVLAKSKGFRQAVLGQSCNNKKYTKILRHFTAVMLKELDVFEARIYGINDEEIHFYLGDSLDGDIVKNIKDIKWSLPVKASIFKVEYKESFGNRVRIDTYYDSNTLEPLYKRLWGNGGDGNRFYLHFKNLIINEDIDERDTIIKKDGLYFQFCGDNYNEITEYKWLERWVKPLISYTTPAYPDKEYYRTSDGMVFGNITLSSNFVKLNSGGFGVECDSYDKCVSYLNREYLDYIKSYFKL